MVRKHFLTFLVPPSQPNYTILKSFKIILKPCELVGVQPIQRYVELSYAIGSGNKRYLLPEFL